MRAYLSGSAIGWAICFAIFGDRVFVILAVTFSAASLAFKVEDSIREQD